MVVSVFDHVPGQRGVVTALGDTVYDFAGYTLDPVALQDLWHLRFQWFDWIFKGATKPALLADRVNYQVMGANVWKHAPSISAMSNRRLRLYFTADRAHLPGIGANAYRLRDAAPTLDASIVQPSTSQIARTSTARLPAAALSALRSIRWTCCSS